VRSIVMCLVAGAACLAAAPGRVERAVPFAVGETLTYDVAWSSFLTAGTAVATVVGKEHDGGSVAYHIVAEGRPLALVARLYTLYYKVDTLLDSYTLLPHRASVYMEEGSRKRTLPAELGGNAPRVLDPLSAVYVLRATPLRPGATLTLPVVEHGIVYNVDINVRAPETVACGLGTIAAWPVGVSAVDRQGKAAARHMAIWISTDARRLPVKLRAELPVGEFDLLLRSVT
jgi:hypothetical protein